MIANGRFKRSVIVLFKAVIVTSLFALIGLLVVFFGLSILDISSLVITSALIHGWVAQVFMLATVESRSRLEMVRYSKQVLFRTILSSSVAIVIAYVFRSAVGVIVAETIMTLLVTVWIFKPILSSMRFPVFSVLRLAAKNFKQKDWQVSAVLFWGSIFSFFGINLIVCSLNCVGNSSPEFINLIK